MLDTIEWASIGLLIAAALVVGLLAYFWWRARSQESRYEILTIYAQCDACLQVGIEDCPHLTDASLPAWKNPSKADLVRTMYGTEVLEQ